MRASRTKESAVVGVMVWAPSLQAAVFPFKLYKKSQAVLLQQTTGRYGFGTHEFVQYDPDI